MRIYGFFLDGIISLFGINEFPVYKIAVLVLVAYHWKGPVPFAVRVGGCSGQKLEPVTVGNDEVIFIASVELEQPVALTVTE